MIRPLSALALKCLARNQINKSRIPEVGKNINTSMIATMSLVNHVDLTHPITPRGGTTFRACDCHPPTFHGMNTHDTLACAIKFQENDSHSRNIAYSHNLSFVSREAVRVTD